MRHIVFFRLRWLGSLATWLPVFLVVAFTLSGCVMSNGPVSQASNRNANQMVVVGIPVLLGGFGSAVPISSDYMITAKHVAQLSWDFDLIHHPYCDLSLIRRRSENVPTWGLIYPDQPVSHHGHSLLGNSIKGDGKYLQDVVDTNTDCLYSLSDAPVMSGMSGGPVFNADGEIAGITVAIVHNPEDLRNLRPAVRYSQFVPATLIFDWLDALGIETSSASPELASIQVSQYVAKLNRPSQSTHDVASTRPAPGAIEENNSEQVTPMDNQSNTVRTSPSPLLNYKPRPASGLFSTSEPLPPDNSAEALSGLRSEPESEPQLTSKQPSSIPHSKPSQLIQPGYNSSQ